MISTERQQQIVNYISNGHSPVSIGNELGLSNRTIEKHIELMKAAHGAVNIPHLVAIFFRKKLVS